MATDDQSTNGQSDDTGGAGGDSGRDVNLNINVSGKGDDKDDKDSLADKDTSKFDDTQKNDYIEKLKDENARRRIANKKLQKNIDKMTADMEKMKADFESVSTTVKEKEEAEKEASLKEKSEIERLQTQMQDLQKAIDDATSENQRLKSENAKNTIEIQKKSRENMVDRLVRQLKFEFSSDYERNGFIGDLLKTDADGNFEKDDEEIIYEVKQLAKTRGSTEDINTPGSGPKGKMTSTPLAQEVQTLLAKENLTAEENERLDQILEEIEQKQSA